MKFDAQKILWLLLLLTLAIGGCVAMPAHVVESVEELHKGSIIIDGDYVELVVRYYAGEERNNKLLLVEKHLMLSSELARYCREHKDE